jgi:glycosyltransferase involved in cell wall biosynthesis
MSERQNNSATPYFSICIPVFNGEPFIRNAVESVLRQDFADWEIIVVDNMSTDATWDILQSAYASHPKIRLERNSSNIGIRGNLKRCLAEARGRWLGILSADDTYVSHALATIYRETREREDLTLWMHAHLVMGDGIVPNICPVFNFRQEFSSTTLSELMYLKGNVFGELSSFFIFMPVVRSTGATFNDGLQSVDTRFYIRLLRATERGTAIYWPDVLTHVLQHQASGSNQNISERVDIIDLFEFPQSLKDERWPVSVMLKQLARMLKCWIKFGARLPPGRRGLPWATIRTLAVTAVSSGGRSATN